MNEILIYGDIGAYGEVNPTTIVRQLQAVKGQPVNLRILSGGGDVFGGLALYNYIRATPNVTASIDGLAASIASIVMLGASRVTMPRNGFVMVHNPTGVAVGEAKDMTDLSELLTRTGQQMAGIYARETGQAEKVTGDWMAGETWFDADQALAAGLIDEITEPMILEARANFDLGRFSRTPTALLKQFTPRSEKGTLRMNKLLDALRARKIIGPEDTDEDAITAKFGEAITGLVSQRDALAAMLKEGLEARAKVAVEAAVAEGRVAKTVQAEFVSAYLRDEAGTSAILASLPKPAGTGTHPVGFGGTNEATDLLSVIQKETDPRKRVKAMANNWDALVASRQ